VAAEVAAGVVAEAEVAVVAVAAEVVAEAAEASR
jgi:hypothetical protein